MVQFTMNLSDRWPRFQGHEILKCLIIENDTKWSYTVHDYVRFSVVEHD